VVVHSAGIQDRDGAKLVFKRAKTKLKTITKIFADGGFAGKLIAWTEQKYNLVLEIVKRNQVHTFVVLPKRWIIERTNAWVSSVRRLAKEYEVKHGPGIDDLYADDSVDVGGGLVDGLKGTCIISV